MRRWCAIIFLLATVWPMPGLEAAEKDLLLQGNYLAGQGQYEEAARYYKRVLEEDGSAAAAYNLAVIYQHELNFKAKAILYYQRFLESAPHDPEAAQVGQWLRQCQADIDPQAAPAENNPQMDTSSPVNMIQADGGSSYIQQANQHLAQGQYEKAILAYRQGMFIDRAPVACYNLAVLYDYGLHYSAQAIYYYQRYLGLSPSGDLAAKAKSRLEKLKQELAIQKNSVGGIKVYRLRS